MTGVGECGLDFPSLMRDRVEAHGCVDWVMVGIHGLGKQDSSAAGGVGPKQDAENDFEFAFSLHDQTPNRPGVVCASTPCLVSVFETEQMSVYNRMVARGQTVVTMDPGGDRIVGRQRRRYVRGKRCVTSQ